MIFLRKNKRTKGQTIVEVMVALVVLILAMSGTFALIINAVNLVMRAQSRTEAVAIAQKGLAEGVLELQNNCSVANSDKLGQIYTTVDSNNSTRKTLMVSATGYVDDNQFYILTAKVEWSDRGDTSPQSVTVSQLVRKGTP